MSKIPIIVILNILFFSNFLLSQHNSDFNLSIIDLDKNQTVVVLEEAKKGVIDSVVIGKNGMIFTQIVQSYIVNKKNLSVIVKVGDHFLIYMWMKKLNDRWVMKGEKYIWINTTSTSRIFDDYENNGGKYPYPFAYYITKVNQLVFVYKNKNQENIKEVFDFTDN